MQNPYLYTVFQHIIARDVVRKLIQVIYFLLISTFLSNKNNQVIKVPKLLLTASKSKIKLNTFFPILTHYKYIPMHMVIMYISRSSIIGMTWSKKSSPIIEIPIIEIPIIYYYLKNRNPDNRGTILQMEYFINPGIARITVIEVPIIEDSLYIFLMWAHKSYEILEKLFVFIMDQKRMHMIRLKVIAIEITC